MSAGTLSEVVVCPLKSAGGIRTTETKVDRWGLAHDRRFLVDDPDGVFLTQRQLPRVALIVPQRLDGALVLDASRVEGLELALNEPGPPTQTIRVGDDFAQAVPLGQEAADWMSTFLETPCSLV